MTDIFEAIDTASTKKDRLRFEAAKSILAILLRDPNYRNGDGPANWDIDVLIRDTVWLADSLVDELENPVSSRGNPN